MRTSALAGSSAQSSALQDRRIVLIALAKQGHILRDGVAFQIEAPGVGAIGLRGWGQRIAVHIAIDWRLDIGRWIGPRRRFFTLRRAGQSNRTSPNAARTMFRIPYPPRKIRIASARSKIFSNNRKASPRAPSRRGFSSTIRRA